MNKEKILNKLTDGIKYCCEKYRTPLVDVKIIIENKGGKMNFSCGTNTIVPTECFKLSAMEFSFFVLPFIKEKIKRYEKDRNIENGSGALILYLKHGESVPSVTFIGKQLTEKYFEITANEFIK